MPPRNASRRWRRHRWVPLCCYKMFNMNWLFKLCTNFIKDLNKMPRRKSFKSKHLYMVLNYKCKWTHKSTNYEPREKSIWLGSSPHTTGKKQNNNSNNNNNNNKNQYLFFFNFSPFNRYKIAIKYWLNLYLFHHYWA